MTFAAAVETALRKSLQFSGRASRKEYFSYLVFFWLALIPVALVASVAPVALVAWLVLFIPTIALQVRRVHDSGHSGWLLLVALVPTVGSLVLLFLMIEQSQAGDNKYGPHPYRPGETVHLHPENWAPPGEGSAPGALWASK